MGLRDQTSERIRGLARLATLRSLLASTAFSNWNQDVQSNSQRNGIVGQNNFLQNFSNFILFLSYLLIPWTAINLADFCLRRHGIYGRVNWRTMIAYVVAIFVEVPFVNSTFDVGLLAKPLGEAGISWIVGMVIGDLLYILAMRPVVSKESNLETIDPAISNYLLIEHQEQRRFGISGH